MFVVYVAYMILYCIIQTDSQTIALCSNPIKSGSCLLTCETPGTTQTVDFYLGSTSQGNCIDLSGSPVCSAGLSQTGNITTLTISSLSKTAHEGVWTCRYGAQSSAAETLTVYTEPSVTTFINVSSTTPVSGKKFKIVDLSARSYCFFPAVTSANVQYSLGISGSVISLSTSGVSSGSGTSVGCDAHEFDLQTNVTVNIESSAYTGLSGKSDVYFQITFTSLLGTQYSTDFRLGPYDFEESIGPECPLILYALLPVLFITLIGTIIVIVVACCADKDGKLSESSMEKSCGCCPHKNMFCMAVCPLCTDQWCTGSKKTGSSVIWKNIISVVGFTIVAVIVGLIIAYGLGLDSGKCILALILSIICGLVLVAIFTVSVYPHWPCLPEKGEDDSTEPDNPDVIIKPAENPDVTTTPEEGTKSYINCFMPCRVNPSQDTIKTDENNSGKKNPKREPAENQASPNKETPRKTDENNSGKKNPKREPAENQASPNRETPRSPQASASGIQLTTAEGRSPRPLVKLPAIVNESTLNTKEMGTPLPVPPISKKQLAPVQTIQTEDTRDEEETRKKRKKKKKNKKKEGEENGGDDKRDSQNSGGQANVEEEEQK